MSLLEPRAVLSPDLELLYMNQIKSLRVAKRFLTVTSTNLIEAKVAPQCILRYPLHRLVHALKY
jgi:hypothetical protein